jgi:hypothetical protein
MSNQATTQSAPVVGRMVRAQTTTRTAQNVVIEVSMVESETEQGWIVYGYRKHRGTRPRQSYYPQLYFIPKVTTVS